MGFGSTEHGAIVKPSFAKGDYSVVHNAAEKGNLEVLQLLMQAGGQCALNRFDYISRTPLMCAIDGGHNECARFLIEQGSDVNANDEDRIGDTAIQRAVEEGHVEIVEMLLQAGADPVFPGWMQRTALDKALDRQDETGKHILALMEKYRHKKGNIQAPPEK